jgi:hypothetical protein
MELQHRFSRAAATKGERAAPERPAIPMTAREIADTPDSRQAPRPLEAH